jgi:hypothetical protein
LLYYREKSLIIIEEKVEAPPVVEVPAPEPEPQPEPPPEPKLKKVDSKAKYYDDYFEDKLNNKRLRKHRKRRSKNPETEVPPKLAGTSATSGGPEENVVQNEGGLQNEGGPSAVTPQTPAVESSESVDFDTSMYTTPAPSNTVVRAGGVSPGRAFTEFPLKVRPAWQHPRSALETDIIIGIFFVLSLIVSAVLCYLLAPSEYTGRCENDRGKGIKWFTTW